MQLMEQKLSAEEESLLDKTFVYDSETGLIAMRNEPKKAIGAARASRGGNRYIRIKVFRTHIAAHRLAWRLITGSWPSGEIDHVDGNTLNNKRENIRNVPRTINQRNQKRNCRNTTGVCGVVRYGQKFRASFKINDKKQHLGTFERIGDAEEALKRARSQHGFSPDHGKR